MRIAADLGVEVVVKRVFVDGKDADVDDGDDLGG